MAKKAIAAAQEVDSYLSLGRLPDKDDSERLKLEGLLAFWRTQTETAKLARSLDWFRNRAFLAGNHYPSIRWSGDTVSFDSPRLPKGAVDHFIPKTVDNKLIRPYEHNVSLLTERRPKPRVEPNSDQPEDEDAAALGEVVFDLMFERLGLPYKQRQLAANIVIDGTAALEIAYEETDIPLQVQKMKRVEKPDPVLTNDDGTPVVNETWEPTDEVEVRMKEDLVARVWNAFELQPDPGATDDIDSLSWIRRSHYVDVTWARERFDRDLEGYHPRALEAVNRDVATNSALYYYERVKDVLDMPENRYGLTGLPMAGPGNPGPNIAVMDVWDVKPSRTYPRGRTFITVGGKLCYASQARGWHERYPERWHRYAMFRWWTIPGRFWGLPLISVLIPLQRRINAIDSLIQLNREFMVIGQWMVPTTSRVPDGVLGGVPGTTIPYRPSSTGAKPERVPHEPLPSETWQERGTCLQAIDSLAGTERALEGESNSAVRAGVMLDFFKRQQLAAKANVIQNYNTSLELVGQNILLETSINMERPDTELVRQIRAAARDHSTLAVQTFVGSDLRDNVRLRLDIGSEIMDSPEAKRQLAIEFPQYIRREWTPEEISTLAKAAGFHEFEKKDSAHVMRARRLVSRIKSGFVEFAFPLPVDDPGIFAEVIRNEMLKDGYHDVPEEAKRALIQLMQYYEQRLLEREQAMRERMIMDQAMLSLAQKGELPGGVRGAGGAGAGGAGKNGAAGANGKPGKPGQPGQNGAARPKVKRIDRDKAGNISAIREE